MGERPIIILGLGNIMMGDEGFGVHFIRWLAGRYRPLPGLEIIDGGTLGYVLLDTICRARHVIVIDCIRLVDTPGSLYRFDRKAMEAHLPPPRSAHEVKFSDVLCKAEMMGECPGMTFLCVVPERIVDMDLKMTPAVQGRFLRMEEILMAELATHFLFPERIEPNARPRARGPQGDPSLEATVEDLTEELPEGLPEIDICPFLHYTIPRG